MIEVTDESFEAEVMESNQPVVIDFWATWCNPCRAMAPIFETVAAEFEGKAKFVKIDIEVVNPNIAQQFNVRAIPTLVLVKHGGVVNTLSGAHPQERISAWLLTNL
ncbi:thioredoxin [Candidatus Thorarchaeota archaeon]|nr:MAG: thioredoxin [Candidatus Thorarchaeota archaeon]